MYYSVYIDVGSHHWDVELSPTPGVVTDDILPLDGLRIGWSVPQGLWPMQPDPLSASLALNVPDARDVADLAEGDPVAIEVKLDPDDTVPMAAFYGRVTDLRSTPRADRDGVTISVVAIDYTPDTAPLEPLPDGFHPFAADTVMEVLQEVWSDRPDLGDFPAWPTVIDPLVVEDQPGAEVREIIDFQLRQAITGFASEAFPPYSGTPDGRLILAPNIDPATRVPDVDQPWAFDLVKKASGFDPFLVPGHLVETGSMVWQFQKGNGPTRVFVTDGLGIKRTAEHAGVGRHVTEELDSSLSGAQDSQAMADFYLPSDAVSRWRLETFRYLVSRDPEADLADFYANLFPRHTVAPVADNLTRGACYGHPIEIDEVPLHRIPLAGTGNPTDTRTITGRLSGAELTISGRHVSIDMQLRQTAT
jgi:hypothetical protein